MPKFKRFLPARVPFGSLLLLWALTLAFGSGVYAVLRWSSAPSGARSTASAPSNPEAERWTRAALDRELNGWRLPNGTVLDASCGERLTDPDRGVRLARLSAAVAFASEQGPNCFEAYRFPDPTNVAPTLARARIRCAELEGANGVTQLARNHGYHFFRRPFAPLITTQHYDGKYEIQINVGHLSDIDLGYVTDVAKTIFHEILHFYSNNTEWHNDPTKDHQPTGCERSMYVDRVYFLSGACFPLSFTGMELHMPGVGAARCENVCDEAFSFVDPDANGPMTLVYGADALLARPLKPGDRRISCKRVRDAHSRRFEAFSDTERLRGMIEAGVRAFPSFMEGTELHRDLLAFNEVVFGPLLRFRSAEAALARYNALRGRLARSFDRVCAGGAPSDSRLNDLCLDRRVRIFGMLDHLRTHLMRFEDADFLVFRAVADPGQGLIVRMLPAPAGAQSSN